MHKLFRPNRYACLPKLPHVVLALCLDEISSYREQVYIEGPISIPNNPAGLHLGGSGDGFNSITPMSNSTVPHNEVARVEAGKLRVESYKNVLILSPFFRPLLRSTIVQTPLYTFIMLLKFIALSLAVSVAVAVPNPIPQTVSLLERQSTETIYWYPNTSSLTRQNPTYNKTQLDEIKLAYTSNDRLSLIRSYGNTDDYFKYDFSPTLSSGNAGSGQGGQGILAQVGNFPVLMGTGLSLAMGFLGPC